MTIFLNSFFFGYLSLVTVMLLGGSLIWTLTRGKADTLLARISIPAKIGAEFSLGVFALIVFGMLAEVFGYPRLGIKLLVATTTGTLLLFNGWKFAKTQGFLELLVHAIRWGWSRLCIAALPGVLLCFFFSSQFTAPELKRFTDPWLVTSRLKVYPVIDHYLQWQVADNFYRKKNIETNFNRDGKQLWSAGDRPIMWGYLNALFSRLLDTHQLLDYFYRTILFSSLLWVGVIALVLSEFKKITRITIAALIVPMMMSPFFVTNFLFSWPKVLGLTFGIMGMTMMGLALRGDFPRRWIVGTIAGIAFALGTLSHTAAIFCLFAALIYYFFVNYKPMNIPGLSRALIIILIPFFVITQFHRHYLQSHTNQTGLLARVQLCRDGSYVYPTPPKTLLQACSEYLDRVGWSGVLYDRLASLERTLTLGDIQVVELLNKYFRLGWSFSGIAPELDLLYQVYTFVSNGIYFLPALLLSVVMLIRRRREFASLDQSDGFRANLFLPVAAICTVGFCAMLGETSTMVAHVLPYIVPLFVLLGTLLTVWSISPKFMVGVSMIITLFHSAILIFRIPQADILESSRYDFALTFYFFGVIASIVALPWGIGSKAK